MAFQIYLHPISAKVGYGFDFLLMKTQRGENNINVISSKLNMKLNEPGNLELTLKKSVFENVSLRFKELFYKETLIVSVVEKKEDRFSAGTEADRKEIWRGVEVKRELDFYDNIYILFDGVLSITKYLIGKLPDSLKKASNDDDKAYSLSSLSIINNFFSTIPKYNNFDLLYFHNTLYYSISDNDEIRGSNVALRKVDNLYDYVNNVLKEYLIGPHGGYLIPEFTYTNSSWSLRYLSSSYLPNWNDKTYFYKIAQKNKNIIDFKKETSFDNVYTGMFPIGEDGLLLTLDKNEIEKNCVFLDTNDLDLVYRIGKKIIINEYPKINSVDSLKTTAQIELRNTFSKVKVNLKIDMFDEDILSTDKFILLPGEVFTYLSPSGYHINVLCNECEIDFMNPEKSVWKSGYDSESLTSRQNVDSIKVGSFFFGHNDFEIDIPITDYFENLID